MGAVEVELPVPTELLVTTTSDQVDALPGDGSCSTTTEKDGPCSLRAAVQEANRLPENQTIIVPEGTYVLAIPYGDGEDGFDPAAVGDLDILDNVTVKGNNRTMVIVDANDLSRVFEVGINVQATIQDMTIRNGTDLGGGGLHVMSEGSLTLDNMIVEDNVSTFKGGGIETSGLSPILIVRNSIVRNNRAPNFGGDGGGINADGETTIHRSRIRGNQASGSGGGLKVFGEVTVTRSTIAGNTASGSILANGGGISALRLNLVSSTVSGNSADSQGGGVFASGVLS
jgi:CSLREA domain-containing protein